MTDDGNECGGDGGATLTYLEFYSGIGGWTLALEKACRDIANNSNTSCDAASKNIDSSGDDGSAAGATGAVTSPRISVRRLASYDHSDLCNAVFAHNFVPSDEQNGGGSDAKPSAEKRHKANQNRAATTQRPPPPPTSLPTYPIEKLRSLDLAILKADIWVMPPPCQPHTRQHDHHSEEEELNDPRSQSFLHLIACLEEIPELGDMLGSKGTDLLPSIILLENVVGFEASASCQMYKRALSDNGYIFAEFHLLNPTQVGIPNDRPRYYCCAVKNTKRSNSAESVASKQLMDMFQNSGSTDSISVPSASDVLTSIPSLGVVEPGEASALPTISFYLDKDLPPLANDAPSIDTEKLDKLQVSKKTIEKSAAWCFDIVTLDDARSACFTSSYGKFVKGTGSVLYYGSDNSIAKDSSVDDAQSKADGQVADTFRLVDPKERAYDDTWWKNLVSGDGDAPPLRYLSGEEVARLMGFPLKENTTGSAESTFSFPEWCTEKQKWRLLGNSINVVISARIAELGIRMITSKKSDEGCKQHAT